MSGPNVFDLSASCPSINDVFTMYSMSFFFRERSILMTFKDDAQILVIWNVALQHDISLREHSNKVESSYIRLTSVSQVHSNRIK